MTVLSKNDIETLLKAQGDAQLFITPLLDPNQLSAASVDVRLGPEIIVLERSGVGMIDLSAEAGPDAALLRHARRIYIGYRNSFVLHPGELVLRPGGSDPGGLASDRRF